MFRLGVDLGGTTVKIAYFDQEGTLLHKWEIPTVTAENGSHILPDIAAAIAGYLAENSIPSEDIIGVGIGVPGPVNAVISGKVISTVDCGTHTTFIAEVTEAAVLSEDPSVTYQFYFDHIKPAPMAVPGQKAGWVCKICGYVYEGEELPEDYVCPLCKHGAADFEPVK